MTVGLSFAGMARILDMLGTQHGLHGFIVHSNDPFNAEPVASALLKAPITSVGDFYVRTHGDIPDVDPSAYRLAIEGKSGRRLEHSLGELQTAYPIHTITAVLQCAGNRRADMQTIETTSGDPWQLGAIGNAQWTGVSLADVLRAVDPYDGEEWHVAFEGLDIAQNEGAEDAPYGVSIPLVKAMSGEVLLAWAMNGEPLTKEHGAPLRLIVPGYGGVRSVKWLGSVRVQAKPSDAFQQSQDYLLFPSAIRKQTRDLAQGMVINEMPLNSAICEPADGATMLPGLARVRGYALAPGRLVSRVEVSINQGRTWHRAEIDEQCCSPWSWVLWQAEVELPVGNHELAVRAWDTSGQTQPASIQDVWNFKGYLCAAWHRVQVNVEG